MNSGVEDQEAQTMLYCDTAKLDALRTFAGPARCPHCGDLLVAPLASEFVEVGEIRHHWECETCGRPSSSTIPLSCDDTVTLGNDDA